jgi:hypothetical protein
MPFDSTLNEVQERLRTLDGFRAMEVLDDDFIQGIKKIEMDAEAQTRSAGLMPVINEALNAVLDRSVVIAIVVESRSDLLNTTKDLLQMKDQKGQLLGEWVQEGERANKQRASNAQFLSNDFVLYRDVVMEGEPRMVLPVIAFPYLEGIRGISDVVSASPSVETDKFIRKRLRHEGKDLLSHLLGFNIDPDHPTNPGY